MYKKWFLGGLVVALLATCALPAAAQESTVKGNLGGTLYDTSGGVVPGAKVTLTGTTGRKTQDSDKEGEFLFPLLIPGIYSVRVEKQGFKAWEGKGYEVLTGRTTAIRVTLETGQITQTIEVTAGGVAVDTSSTAIGANLSDTFYRQVPVQRGVAGLFYLSAGVASGGGSGPSNPSISGGSGLENLYVADGVNITDASFGGLGIFSRIYGSLGTGINLSFIKEVQVKTGGYEPQYGRATGGIIQIVTKSGGNTYHGAIAGYFAPRQFEATRLHPDDFGRTNLLGKTINEQGYDASAEVGGYIPGLRDKFFIFGSINPSYKHELVRTPSLFALSSLGEMNLRTNTLNYAFKGTFKFNDKHSVESSIFGDPSHTSRGAFRRLVMDNQTAFTKLEFGTRNLAARYNGAITPSWFVNASFTWGFNEFNETGFADLHRIIDRTQAAGLPGQRGIFTSVGLGFVEPTKSNTYGANIDTTKEFRFAGKHSFNIGYRYERPFYEGTRSRSGPSYLLPATNAAGLALTSMGVPAQFIGQPSQPEFSLRLAASSCTLCPRMTIPGFSSPRRVFLRGDRNEIFAPVKFKTEGAFHAAYVMDSWSPSKYITMNLGLRWEQQHMEGELVKYTWTGNWSPRVGVIVDPWGNRRTKAYANFGRYNYAIPLDMAERSLTNEVSILLLRFAPQFTGTAPNRQVVINQFGGVTPVLDAAHLLNRAPGGTGGNPFSLAQSTTGIAPGTKMEYLDEFVVGFEHEFKGGVVVSARYIDRRMKRIVEDGAGISPEATNAGLNQNYLIFNVKKTTDLYVNEKPITYTPGATPGNTTTGWPSACNDANANPTPFFLDPVEDTFQTTLGAVCYPGLNAPVWTDALGDPLPGVLFGGEPTPDGVPDGFPNALRNYWAVEIEVNKSFTKNWQLRANWRIAKLFGNFEGAFRNDNGQTDPSISSLFDFTEGIFGLLGDQFKPGVLNTDRRHIVNVYSSYVLDRSALKGLTLGVGVRVEQGIPINRLKAHPAYLNSGEVPVGGRGALGRLPVTGTVDIHVDYPWRLTEKMKLRFGMDLFNIANARRQLQIDQNEDASFGTKNVDFLKPDDRRRGFQRPFSARAMVRFEF